MKPIYKTLELTKSVVGVGLTLQAKVSDGTEESEVPISADILESLRVELIAPNVSGARDLIKSGECLPSENSLQIVLVTNQWLKGGVYRLQVSATYGTQTEVIYVLDISVPRYNALLIDEMQLYTDTVTVVSTVGGSGGGGADTTVYALDDNGNAHITKPLTVSGSVREGTSTASGINSHAEGTGASASGTNSHAEGQSTAAYGINSHAEGSGTIAQQTSQHVCGQFNVIDTNNSYQFIVGNGAGAEERHNAFAVTKSGELALFKADGTPVILSAANLEALIASLS